MKHFPKPSKRTPPAKDDPPIQGRSINPVIPRVGSLQQLPRSGYQHQRIAEEKQRLPPTRGIIQNKDVSTALGKDLPKARIPRPVLMAATTQTLLRPHILDLSDVPPKVTLVRYQFQTPPRVRSTAVTPQGNLTLHRLPQKLPKLDLSPAVVPTEAPLLSAHATHKSDSCPNTARGTPETEGRGKLREQGLGTIGEIEGVVSFIGVRTRTGMTGGKRKRFNQDTYSITHNFAGTLHQILFALFDGHGLHGHDVSDFLKRAIPREVAIVLQREMRNRGKTVNAEEEDNRGLRAALYEGMLKGVEGLLTQKKVDVTFSGSTAITILLRSSHLVCGNIGDSRAVLGQQTSSGWSAFPLSHDHKPDSPTEKKRIEECGGRVQPYMSKRECRRTGGVCGTGQSLG